MLQPQSDNEEVDPWTFFLWPHHCVIQPDEQWKNTQQWAEGRVSSLPESKLHPQGSSFWRWIMQANLCENAGGCQSEHRGVATLRVIDWSLATANCEIRCSWLLVCAERWRTESERRKQTVIETGIHRRDKVQWERETDAQSDWYSVRNSTTGLS